MADDSLRGRILARRAAFVAAALATMGDAGCKSKQEPAGEKLVPAQFAAPSATSPTSTAPMACLTVMMNHDATEPPPAVGSASSASSATPPDAGHAKPHPCLTIVHPRTDPKPIK